MDKNEFLVRFEGISAAKAGEKANLLLEVLRNADPDVQADLKKVDTETMDLGTTVVLVFGAPAIVAIAKGIANFVGRERPGKLYIETKDGKVIFSGDSGDAARIATAFAKNQR